MFLILPLDLKWIPLFYGYKFDSMEDILKALFYGFKMERLVILEDPTPP
jgi:hypothetical protein